MEHLAQKKPPELLRAQLVALPRAFAGSARRFRATAGSGPGGFVSEPLEVPRPQDPQERFDRRGGGLPQEGAERPMGARSFLA